MASGDRPSTGPKPSGKKAKVLSQEEQSERFIKAARDAGVDETGEAFDRAFEKIIPTKPKEREHKP